MDHWMTGFMFLMACALAAGNVHAVERQADCNAHPGGLVVRPVFGGAYGARHPVDAMPASGVPADRFTCTGALIEHMSRRPASPGRSRIAQHVRDVPL